MGRSMEQGDGGTPELDRFTQFAVEHLADATYWMKEDGSFIYVNEAASRLTGYRLDQLRSMTVFGLNVELRPEAWAAHWKLLRAQGRRTFEARHQRQDGRFFDVEITAHLLQLDGREYSCAFVRDISERKQMEQKMRQAEKMEAIGRLAGGVAHDFNNQLTGIFGCADLLREMVRENAEAVQLVDDLSQIARVAAALTAQLLAFSRKGKLLVQPIDLHRLILDVVAILSRSVDKRIRVETGLGAPRFWVTGDPSQVQNAILNLALNARDAMPSGGTLTFATANVDFDDSSPERARLELSSGAYVALSVRDTGIGMTRETRERVFEPFFTTKEVGAGTGLGLASVYGTIRNHRGAIVVDSVVDRGTVFTAYLPLAGETAIAQPHVAEPPRVELNGHVLVVDDEPTSRDVEAAMLRALGCTVATAEDGQSALSKLREAPSSVDVVLLDMTMPGMTGAETFRAMKEIHPEVQVLAMSGYTLDGAAQVMLDAGARGFLQKPFTMAELAGKVSEILK
jgi:two-component system, cell cycle sensor histidine kinase and response regulator CckA